MVIEREFAASMDVVWRLWTEPSLFAEWYGPKGATIPVAEMDVRPGGSRRVAMAMETPNGPDLGERTRIVLTHAGIPAGSPGEMGWNMALDSLAERLAQHRPCAKLRGDVIEVGCSGSRFRRRLA